MKMKTDQIKPIFHNLIDERAYEFIAKKVSMMNGDIRVAFDYMKTALSVLADDLAKEMPEDKKIKISESELEKIVNIVKENINIIM